MFGRDLMWRPFIRSPLFIGLFLALDCLCKALEQIQNRQIRDKDVDFKDSVAALLPVLSHKQFNGQEFNSFFFVR